MNSLNPIIKINSQMMDVIKTHTDFSDESAKEKISNLLEEVGLPEEVIDMYPHELSGGMKQRVIIAIAMALKPTLIVADEPVTALDLVVQRGVLQVLSKLRNKYGISMLFVAHDMAVHAQLVDKLIVMYAGKIMEIGPIKEVFKEPLHPYTKLLIKAIPSIKRKKIKGIPGVAPSPLKWPSGCRFHPRCPLAKSICTNISPRPITFTKDRWVSCNLFGDQYE
jgi:peptide/nickel transport system ATP-binding protein